MFMKSQFSARRGQHVSAFAVHGDRRSNCSAAAVLLGVALQVAVVSTGAADAISMSLEQPADTATKVENALGQSATDVKNLLDGPGQVSPMESTYQ